MDSINLQLRQLFSPLSRPANNYRFLYDMAAHVTDSVYFQTACPDTNVTDSWYRVYEEMYHSAYDTMQFVHPNDVFIRGNQFYSDTIPIGIMHFSHYVLKPDALQTDDYFDFDTVHTILTDKAGRPDWPYLDAGIFMAAPMVAYTNVRNPVFRIDPQLIFYDNNTGDSYKNGAPLRINFGDGNGWVSFNPSVVTNHPVTYTDSGEHVIVVNRSLNTGPEIFSRSIIGTGMNLPVPPDDILRFPGMTVGFYGGCGGTLASGKTIIYVEGIDPADKIPGLNSFRRNLPDIYREMIRRDRIVQLKNFGYNFLVVNWNNSTIDMRYNALYLVNLLHQLKCGVTADDQQFVVVGESMGGVIARYALRYMETEDYLTGNGDVFFADNADPDNIMHLVTHPGIGSIPASWPASGCRMEKMHNTRLLITIDAPHQGANIPLAAQHAYRTGLGIFSRYIGGNLLTTMAALNNLFLDAQAAQQLLIYHVDTRSGIGFAKNYASHPDKDDFYNQLAAMGNYPQFAKVVTMSNGDISGQGQQRATSNDIRTPGDRLLDFNADIHARVLGIRVPVFGGTLEALTNNNGRIYRANAGYFRVRIRLRWFGIRISAGYNSLLFKDEEAQNIVPYCTSAGGIYRARPDGQPGAVTTNAVNLFNNTLLLNLLHGRLNRDGNGCTTFDSHLGINGIYSANLDFSLCSDGTHFCFIPLQSALDYGVVDDNPANVFPPLGHNIQTTDNIAAKLTRLSPGVDVMIGWPNNDPPVGNNNQQHLEWRNDIIPNVNNGFGVGYFSCGTPIIERGMINLEIGDEELYLENVELPWQSDYEAEYIMHVNRRNPNYIYPNQPNSFLNGIYSRDNPFTTGPNGLPTFIFDRAGFPAGMGLQIANPVPANFRQIDQPLFICCQNFIVPRVAPINEDVKKSTKDSYLRLYPNPTRGDQLTLKYLLQNKGGVQLKIYGINGQAVLQKQLPVQDATLLTTSVLQLPNLKPGMYLLRLTNGKETKTAKFIVNR